jgi:hypothetical protein
MRGLCDQSGFPHRGWRCVGDEIEHNTDDNACECCRIKTFRRYLYLLEHDNFDHQIKVGSNCKEKLTKNDSNSESHEDDSGSKSRNQLDNNTSNAPPEEKLLPLPALVLLAGASMLLLGNLSLFEDFYSRLISNESAPPEQTRPSESPEDPNDRYKDELSPEVQKKLRACLEKNIKNLIGVPGLSDLVELLTKGDANSINETQRQIRLLYKKVQRLREIIEGCAPSLIKELVEADRRDEQANELNQEQRQFGCQDSVTIIGKLVNVRAWPSSDSEVVGQVLYGTCLQIDTETFVYLSEEQRQAIVTGQGWYPIVLPDGMRGYIHSRYASRVLPP